MIGDSIDMNTIWKLAAMAALVGLGACSGEPPGGSERADLSTGTASTLQSARGDSGMALPDVVAYRSPSCGCCELWVEHMRAAGFQVDVKVVSNLDSIKSEAGVPAGKGSCHTARVGDYYVEGHVPASDVKQLLAEGPDARGLTVPGMVPGSPGMEQSGHRQPYEVLLIANDGSTSVYARHGH